MATFTRTGLMALILAAAANVALAQQHMCAQPSGHLPRLGLYSEFVGYGEEVTHVHDGSLAERLGLEEGDVIVAINGYRLNYEGAWDVAMRRAARMGMVQLKIRDVNTGMYVTRSFQTAQHVINANTLKAPALPYEDDE